MAKTKLSSPADPNYNSLFFHADGRRKSAKERYREGRASHSKRQAEAPTEQPTPVSLDTFSRIEQARAHGRAMAESAKPDVSGPTNPYAAQAKALEPRLHWDGRARRRHARYLELSHEWDQRQEAEAAEAALRDKLDKDPMVQNAREHATAFLRMTSRDFPSELEAAHEAVAIIESGDVGLYWERVRLVEGRIYARQTAELESATASSNASLTDFRDKADRVRQTADRISEIPE